MNDKCILNLVDHTALSAVTGWSDIQKLCKEAIEYNMASICIPPSYVKRASESYGDKITICTVIGFPLGYSTKETKLFEAKEAIKNGAREIDMVINLGHVKNNDYPAIADEIRSIKEAIGNHILKVIVETCYLTKIEKIKLCEIVTAAKADFIKTSTGFGSAGAQVEDIELFKLHIGNSVQIKASGGIRTREQFDRFVASGVHRIGASAAVRIYV